LLIIIGNLLDNALKYAPPQARVRVSMTATEQGGRRGVVISVSNPVGRAGRPDATRLFEKYYRGTHARHRSGSGPGLYLAQRLATRIGARLSLRQDDGVTFELWVPQ
jgi:signal transduction histidine kinase